MATGNREFFVDSKEELYCPQCGCRLKLRDHKRRVWKQAGGEKRWLKIGRYRCSECNHMHNGLPDFIAMYKHYDRELIEDVIDEVISEEDDGYDISPCCMTMMRWRSWFLRNAAAMEGQIRSAGSRFLDLTEEFLRSTESLLEELRERISPGWLGVVLKIIYNSGGRVEP